MLSKQLPPNLLGKDYAVGDLHGCYSLLMESLKNLNFDFSRDRLFSVGDLVDRGEENIECLNLIRESWFYAVRGNHEQMMIDALPFYTEHTQETLNYANHHCMNGGYWFTQLNQDEKEKSVEVASSLPIIMETIVDGNRIGFVHANVRESWNTLVESIASNNETAIVDTLWSRTRIKTKLDTHIKGIDYIFLGHTPLDEIVTLGNCTYIDTGAVFCNKLSIICINDFIKNIEGNNE